MFHFNKRAFLIGIAFCMIGWTAINAQSYMSKQFRCNTGTTIPISLTNVVVTQSSTTDEATADLAIDGNTSGQWFVDYSVASTEWEAEAWWEVDLGTIYDLAEIEIWGRTDCCLDFLEQYYILISETPFDSQDLNTTLAANGVSHFFIENTATVPFLTELNVRGQYLRIQLSQRNRLQLAEIILNTSSNPATFSGSITTTPISTPGGSDGSLTINTTGGTAPITFLWSNDATTTTIDHLSAGTYQVTATDANDCTFVASATLDNPATDVLTLNCSTDIVASAANNNGKIITFNPPTATTACDDNNTNSCVNTITGFNYAGDLNGSRYFLSDYQTYWGQAKTDCENAGGHLAIIETTAENAFLKDLIDEAHYIGLTDIAEEGVYKWVDGSSPTFSMFGTYQENTEERDYVMLNEWGGGIWSHKEDLVYKFFILEIPCESGIQMTQIAGLTSGSTFPIGTTQISYEVSDACNNVKTCSFAITVQQPLSIPFTPPQLRAKQEQQQIILQWQQATNFNASHYVIERSKDGKTYSSIAEIQGNNNAQTRLSWQDKQPFYGDNFYRIRLRSPYQTTYYSNIQQVYFYQQQPFTLYPNPARQEVQINLSHYNHQEVNIEIYNYLRQRTTSAQTTNNQLIIPLHDFKNGIYQVYISGKNRRRIGQKLVVIK